MIFQTLLIVLSIFFFYRSAFVGIKPAGTEGPAQGRPHPPPAFKRLIYFVIDGMRFDAFVPTTKTGHYFNGMPFVHGESSHKHLFMSVAGVPTITTCRVIALMTGAPTTPSDIVSTHLFKRVVIDNFVRAAGAAQRSCALFGDVFWEEAFPSLRRKSSTICSYSKTDQATREDEIFEALVQNLENGPDDFIFAHFISLDSCGHAFGIDHPRTRETIERMDGYLARVYDKMSEDTLLVVLSDHGVTDQGAHGGRSERELASICGFFSKKEIGGQKENAADAKTSTVKNDAGPSWQNKPFLNQFYDTAHCNNTDDWISATNHYSIIHQDDILVTLSHILGIPAPCNCYGSFIPQLVSDSASWEQLAARKERLAQACCHGFQSEYEKFLARYKESQGSHGAPPPGYVLYNYFLTDFIYRRTTSRRLFSALLALGLALYILRRSYRRAGPLLRCAHTLFATFMVTHSYWSFASEDYFWFAAFLVENHSVANFIALIFYIKSPGRPFFAHDRVVLDRHWGPLNLQRFENTRQALLIMALFAASKFIVVSTKALTCSLRVNPVILKNLLKSLPQTLFSLHSLAHGTEGQEEKLAFLSAFPTLDSLVAVHLPPHCRILVLFFLKNLDIARTPSTRYALLSLLPYFCNVEKTLQTIDYGALFVFTEKYELWSILISAFAYFILPRLLVHGMFGERVRGGHVCNYFFLNVFGLYLCFACFWLMHDSLVGQSFFMSRLLFVTAYFLIDTATAQVQGMRGKYCKLKCVN